MPEFPEYLRNRDKLARWLTHEGLLDLALRYGLPYKEASPSPGHVKSPAELIDWLLATYPPTPDVIIEEDSDSDQHARPRASRKGAD
jgi:hypothetical protein